MLALIVNSFRWFWSDVLLPYVVLALAALVSDGVEAWANIAETLYVVCCFFCGRSHRMYPLPKKDLDMRKKTALELFKVETKRNRAGAEDDDSSEDVTSERNDSHSRNSIEDTAKKEDDDRSQPSAGGQLPGAPQSSKGKAGLGGAAVVRAVPDGISSGPVDIQRRVLLGKKGERELWLHSTVGQLLVPFSFPQSYSHSLHRLVRSVVGPIQLPTVTTMPARHTAPQWPPHFVRSSRSGNVNSGGGGSGGSGGVSESRSASSMTSTDDYGNSNSRMRQWMPGGAGSSSSAGESGGNSVVGAGAVGVGSRGSLTRRGGAGDYQQNAKVVYKRLSKRQMEFQPTRKHMFDAQAIASITAHHVLSYRATRQKVLAVDLDETLCLVSTSTANMLGPPTFSEVIPTTTGAELFHVWERPHVRLFLETMSKLFNLVLFTSASKPYADTILRRIDPNYLLKERYYRQDCRVVSRGALAKTLRERRLAAVGHAKGAGAAAAAAAGIAATTSPAASAAEDDNQPLGAAGTSPGSTDDQQRQRTTSASFGSAVHSRGSSPPVLAGTGTDGNSAAASLASAIARDGDRPPLNESANVLMKDLRVLKVPMELLIMIDNSEECMLLNRDNALIISPYIPSFEGQRKTGSRKGGSGGGGGGGGGGVGEEDAGVFGDPEEDEVLLSLMTFLEAMLVVPDVRSILRHGKLY